MATATACASTAFAGQTVLKQVSELASKVGSSEARVQMRGSRSKSSGSIWSVLLKESFGKIGGCFFPWVFDRVCCFFSFIDIWTLLLLLLTLLMMLCLVLGF